MPLRFDYEQRSQDGIHVCILQYFYRGKYQPHQGKREMRRRLDQIKLGSLRGSEKFISTAVRFAASGLHYV